MMKKLFLVLCLIFSFGTPAFAEYTAIPENLSKQKEINNFNESSLKFEKKYVSTHSINILDKKYTCYYNNCYDLSSFRYNQLTKTYYIDMIMDLMLCNAHQEYLSPYDDGYITHLIFNTKLHNNEFIVKAKGFVTGDVAVDYKNDRAFCAHYNINAIHKGIPTTIKNIEEFTNDFYKLIDINSAKKLLKTW